MTTQLRIKRDATGWEAWGDVTGPDSQEWVVSDNGYTVARVRLAVRKDTRLRLSSGKVTTRQRTEARVTLRISARKEFELLDSFQHYGGPKGAIREIMRWIKSGSALRVAIFDLELKAREAGASDLSLLNARYGGGWRTPTEQDQARSLLGLIEQQEHRKEAVA